MSVNNKLLLGAIIVAAGKSERMSGVDKIFTPLAGKTILEWSVDTCQNCQLIHQIIIVLNKIDLASSAEIRYLEEKLSLEGKNYFLTNALTGENLDTLITFIMKRYLKDE